MIPPHNPTLFGLHDDESEVWMRFRLGEELCWSMEEDWGEFVQDGEWVEI